MKSRFYRCLYRFFLCFLFFVSYAFCVSAAEEAESFPPAADISDYRLITESEGFSKPGTLFDGSFYSGHRSGENPWLTLESEEGIGSLYFLFTERKNPLVITDNISGTVCTVGEHLFLHEFVDLSALFGKPLTSVTIQFGTEPVLLTELQVYTAGQVPASVQKWEPPAEGSADLLLLSAHGDDDQIFFAGVIPHYAVYKGYQVQVVYLIDHYNVEPYRVHEMLDGLWATGLKTYPVFGHHPDFKFSDFSQLARVFRNKEYAYNTFDAQGYSREYLLGFVVEQLRRFKPQVALTHDFEGEYGHPHHVVCADLMTEAVGISMDSSQYPELAEKYGVWDVPKTYIHLYGENEILIDMDTPRECFGGLTAFEVSKDLAFPCHRSQYKGVSNYIVPYRTSVDMRYCSSRYGLYRSTVGEDTAKDDFFENLLTHAQLARKAEEARLAEEARKAEEAQDRLKPIGLQRKPGWRKRPGRRRRQYLPKKQGLQK